MTISLPSIYDTACDYKESTPHDYYICSDVRDTDDYGKEQMSLYKTRVESDRYLNPDEVVKIAEESCDWEVLSFGEGEWSREGCYWIEYTSPTDNEKSWILERFNPDEGEN